MTMLTFGEQLRAYRKAKHMSQAVLAEAVGVSEEAIGSWEVHGRDPRKKLSRRSREINEKLRQELGLTNEQMEALWRAPKGTPKQAPKGAPANVEGVPVEETTGKLAGSARFFQAPGLLESSEAEATAQPATAASSEVRDSAPPPESEVNEPTDRRRDSPRQTSLIVAPQHGIVPHGGPQIRAHVFDPQSGAARLPRRTNSVIHRWLHADEGAKRWGGWRWLLAIAAVAAVALVGARYLGAAAPPARPGPKPSAVAAVVPPVLVPATASPSATATIAPSATLAPSATTAPSATALPTPSESATTTTEPYPPLAPGVEFPPLPAATGPLDAWTYARRRARRYVPPGFSKPPTAPTSTHALPDPTVHGCIGKLTGFIGYLACATDYNAPAAWFAGASARWQVPAVSPDPQAALLEPAVIVGGGPGQVGAGTASFTKFGKPSYLWTLIDYPKTPLYCLSGCPTLHPGDEVFTSVMNSTGYSTEYFLEDLTTGEYTFATEPTPDHDGASAGVLLINVQRDQPQWSFPAVTFQGATLYGHLSGGDPSLIADLLDKYNPLAHNDLGWDTTCVEPVASGSFAVRGDTFC